MCEVRFEVRRGEEHYSDWRVYVCAGGFTTSSYIFFLWCGCYGLSSLQFENTHSASQVK